MKLLTQLIADPIVAYLFKRVDPRVLVAIGYILISSCHLIAYFTTNYYVLLFSLGVMASIGSACVESVALFLCWEWFPDVRGQITGLLSSFSAVGRALYIYGSILYINP